MTPSALLLNSLVDLNLSDIPIFKETTGDSLLTPEQQFSTGFE
jgi:hypothetical protein